MKNHIRQIIILVTLISVAGISFADRGAGRKKVKTILNITTGVSLKNSILNSIRSGLTYKGSLLSSRPASNNTIINSSLMTYQKGNTTYIIPYKNKVAIPEIRQGYAGVKLIIRSQK